MRFLHSLYHNIISGCSIPLGGLVEYPVAENTWAAGDSEFIIFNENQCAIRYIIQMRGSEED